MSAKTIIGALLIAMATSTTACATLRNVAEQNTVRLQQLQPGMSKEDVQRIMGTTTHRSGRYSIPAPYRSEMYPANGKRVEVLYYYTSVNYEVERIADDELTPIVLIDGQVDGWGWSYWENTADRLNIRIRRS
jgi:hypothetical protein